MQLLHDLAANRSICLRVLRSKGRAYIKCFFEAEIDAIIHDAIEQIGASTGALNAVSSEADVQRMTRFYAVSFVAILESWLNGELDYTPEELVSFADQMIQDHIQGARVRAAQARNH